MRTTLTLDDDLAMALQKKAHDEGRTFKDVVNETLRSGLAAGAPPASEPYRVKTWSGGFRPEVDLTKANQLAGQLEDEHILRKMREFEDEQRRERATASDAE